MFFFLEETELPNLTPEEEFAKDTVTMATGAAVMRKLMKEHGTVTIDDLKRHTGIKGLSSSGSGAGGIFWGWAKKIVMACLWAAFIAAGQLVYTHFSKKWEDKGYPFLPIIAMRPPNQQQGSGTFTLGAGPSQAQGATSSGAPKITKDLMDEYIC